MDNKLEKIKVYTSRFAADQINITFCFGGGASVGSVLYFWGLCTPWHESPIVYGTKALYRISGKKKDQCGEEYNYLEIFVNNNQYYAWPLEGKNDNLYNNEFHINSYTENLCAVTTCLTVTQCDLTPHFLKFWQNNHNLATGLLNYINGEKMIKISNTQDVWKINDKFYHHMDTTIMFTYSDAYVTGMSVLSGQHVVRVDVPKGGLSIKDGFKINLQNALLENGDNGSYQSYKVVATKIEPEKNEQTHTIQPIIDYIDKHGLQLNYPTEISELKEIINKTISIPDMQKNIIDAVLKAYEENKGYIIYGDLSLIFNKLKDAAINASKQQCEVNNKQMNTEATEDKTKIEINETSKGQTLDDILNGSSITPYQKTILENTKKIMAKLTQNIMDWSIYCESTVKTYEICIDQIMNYFNSDLACFIVRSFQKNIYIAVNEKADIFINNGFISEYINTSNFLRTIALHGEYHPVINRLIHQIPNKKKAQVIVLGQGTLQEKSKALFACLQEYVDYGLCKSFKSQAMLDQWYKKILNEKLEWNSQIE